MKSYRKELVFNIPSRRAYVNITPQVQACIDESGIKEGLVLVNAMHITASVFVNDDEPGFIKTLKNGLKPWHRKNRTVSISTTDTKIMPTPI